jgi:hypothetical protein
MASDSETPALLLAFIVWFGQDPVILILVPCTKLGDVEPVPPLATGKAVPDNVIARVPVVVIGEPDTLKNAGTDAATLVTVPAPPAEPVQGTLTTACPAEFS